MNVSKVFLTPQCRFDSPQVMGAPALSTPYLRPLAARRIISLAPTTLPRWTLRYPNIEDGMLIPPVG